MLALIITLALVLSMAFALAEGVYKDADTVRSVQKKLSEIGYNIGSIDGMLGQKTKGAIVDFQEKNGLDPTGYIDDRLLDVLDLKAVISEPKTGGDIPENVEGFATDGNGIGDITITPYATVKGGDFITDSNLLKISGKKGYALATLDGRILTEELYGNIYCTYGWISAANVDIEGWNKGVLNGQDGSITVPFIYGEVEILNRNWALAYNYVPATADNYDVESYSNNEYYLINTVDVYWLPTATKVATIPRANYLDSTAYDEYLNIEDRVSGTVTTYDLNMNPLGTVRDTYSKDLIPHYTTFKYNGQQGLLDPDGNEVFPASYQYVNEDDRDGYFEVSTGDKYGLVDRNGNLVVPVDYNRIQTAYYSSSEKGPTYVNFGYACVEKDDRLGYYRVNDKETCEPKYAKSLLENCGVSALFTDMTGNKNILAADGVETALPAFERVSALNSSAGSLYKTNDSDYHAGLIDWHGNEILPNKYSSIDLSSNGHYLVVSEDYSSPTEVYYVSYGESADDGNDAAKADEGGAVMTDASYETVKSLVGSAELLVKTDYASNKSTVKLLIEQALNESAGADQSLSDTLNSILTLIDTDVADENTIMSLIYYIKDMLP